jgi:hypothetical protein
VVVVDAHPAEVDKVVAAVVVNPVAVDRAAVVAEWEEAVGVVARPEAVAAAAVNSSHFGGASQLRGAPLFY